MIRLLLSTCAAIGLALPAAAQEPDPKLDYQPGYDPKTEKRNGIGELPAESWGEEKNGLQAAIGAPATLRMNERVPVYLVVRNVSEDSIRFSMVEPYGGLQVSFGGPLIYGVNRTWDRQEYNHHDLKPGQQTLILIDHLQIMAKEELVPRGAMDHRKPGRVTLAARGNTSAPDEKLPDGTKRKAPRGPDEWTGYVKAAKRSLDLVAEKAQIALKAPPELPEGHGLPHAPDIPGGFGRGRYHWVKLHPKRILHLGRAGDSHWLNDFGTYKGHVYWGPMTTAQLVKFGFLERIKENTLALDDNIWEGASHRLLELLNGEKLLAALGLELVLKYKPAPPKDAPRNSKLDRLIRDRRPDLYAMGLRKEAHAALEHLTANDPPLPERSEFNVVHVPAVLPEGLADAKWGPELDGLRAAALMPRVVVERELTKARLFIRNVSDREIFIAVSNQAGYDHATVIDQEGNTLPVQRPLNLPSGIVFGGIRAEFNPGETGGDPPLATLSKLILKPGAIWEVLTDASLGYNLKNHPPADPDPNKRRGITTVEAAPTEALVTWHLHTANGAEISKDWKQRHWPTRGAWSGILTTAPVKVTLKK